MRIWGFVLPQRRLLAAAGALLAGYVVIKHNFEIRLLLFSGNLTPFLQARLPVGSSGRAEKKAASVQSTTTTSLPQKGFVFLIIKVDLKFIFFLKKKSLSLFSSGDPGRGHPVRLEELPQEAHHQTDVAQDAKGGYVQTRTDFVQ